MAFNQFRGGFSWYGRDSSFQSFPIASAEPVITDTYTGASDFDLTQHQQLVLATKGPITRLPQKYGRRCKLTAAKESFAGYHSAYRMLVTHKNMPSEVLDPTSGNCALSNGADIRFSTDVDGVYELPCEVVTVTMDATPANQRAEIWVLVPGVSDKQDVVLYMWWKGPADFKPWSYSTHLRPSEVWEFYGDFLGGSHGLDSAISPTQPRNIVRPVGVSPADGFSNLVLADVTATPGVWEGNGAFGFPTTGLARHVRIPTSMFDSSKIDSPNGFISLWFKKAVNPFAATYYLFSFGDANAAAPSKKCWARMATNGVITFSLEQSNGTTIALTTSGVTDTNWHHLACCWQSGADGHLAMWLDGVGQYNGTGLHEGVNVPATNILYIGSPNSTSTTEHWYGDIDEVRYGAFPANHGLFATEYFCQKNYDTLFTVDSPTTPTLPAQPFTLLDRQYVMIGPKIDFERSVRYDFRYVAVSFLVITDPGAGNDDTEDAITAHDPRGQGWQYVKHVPAATAKKFLIGHTVQFDPWFGNSSAPAKITAHGSDPSLATQIAQQRPQSAFNYDPADPDWSYAHILPLQLVSGEAQHFTVRLDPAPSGYTLKYHFRMVDFPAASTPGAPGVMPVAAPFTSITAMLDEAMLNGYGAAKEIYLAFTAPNSADYQTVIRTPYGNAFDVVSYGADSTFTTPTGTSSAVDAHYLYEAGLTAGDSRYYKVVPLQPGRELVILAHVDEQ